MAPQLEDTDTHFATNLKAGGVLDVVEKYPWSGEEVAHGRRDKRRGAHTGSVSRCEADGAPVITVRWGDPYGGVCSDAFRVSADGGELTQETDMTVGGERVRYKTVYRRERR